MNIEQLNIENEEFEIAEKMGGAHYSFPVVYIGKKQIIFNSFAAQFLRGWEYAEILFSANFIIFLKSTLKEKNSFAVRISDSIAQMTLPAFIRNKNAPLCGTYKLYSYKNGFAIKKNEWLETTD